MLSQAASFTLALKLLLFFLKIASHKESIYNLFNLSPYRFKAVPDSQSYRDRIYIIKDIIMKLVEYGELNQTALVSFCGLNLKKHRAIFEKMEHNGFISKGEIPLGKRIVTVYKPTEKGLDFCRSILEPYEKLFPRDGQVVKQFT